MDDFTSFSEEYVKQRAAAILESIKNDKNVVCIGPGGTSKTYTVKHVVQSLISTGVIDDDEYVIVSYVGVAALNANGRTINSTFIFPTQINDPTEQAQKWAKSVRSNKRYRSVHNLLQRLRIIINDEFGVTSGKFMKFMNAAFQAYYGNDRPFGGLQMICMGDPLQLLPIEQEDGRPSLSTFILDRDSPLGASFEVVNFDFGFRYTIQEKENIILQKDWFTFLNQLRYGFLPEQNGAEMLHNLGIKVITAKEYTLFEPEVGRLVMAQLNETVDKWNHGINMLYESRNTTIHNLDSIYYDISAKPKKGYLPLNTLYDKELLRAIYKMCLISGHVPYEIDQEMIDDLVVKISDMSLHDYVEKVSIMSIEELEMQTKNIYLKETKNARQTQLSYQLSADGPVPIVLPKYQKIRDQGLVMIRINKASGYPDLVNGTVMTLQKIETNKCVLQQPCSSELYEIRRIPRYHYDMQSGRLTVCCQWPFIQADACTVTKAQGLTLNKAAYLLDERIPFYEMFHSQYVALSRVRDPRDFMYIHSADKTTYDSLEKIMDPKVQLRRLGLAFPKIQKLVKTYKPVLKVIQSLEVAK
jgi:hypothetical protein